jgi:hypothetical protein
MFEEIESILLEAVKLMNDKTLTNDQKQIDAEKFAEKEIDRWQDNLPSEQKWNGLLIWGIKTFILPWGIKLGVAFLKKEGIIK